MTKQQLAVKIWDKADDLYGNTPVKASDYKDYLIGLMF